MFLTLIHAGNGSTTEIADARWVLGPYNTAKEATDAGTEFYDAVRHVDWAMEEVFDTIIELPLSPAANIQEAAKKFLAGEDY